MSIYATHWILKFPEHGDEYFGCEWVTVLGQAVPAHIGTPTPGHGYEDGDPYAGFLPSPVEVNADGDGPLRAMVIVREQDEKVGQEYIAPLLVLAGQEYESMSFAELHRRICDALRGNRPRLVLQLLHEDEQRLVFDDGSVKHLKNEDD